MTIGLRLRRNGSSARRSGGKSSRRNLRSAGKPVGARSITVSQPFEEPFACGASLRESDQGRRELFGRRHQLAEQRIGVEGERFEPVEGQPRLVLEGREGAEQRFDVLVARRGRLEDLVRVADQARRARLRGRAGAEGLRAVAEQLLDRDALGVEDAEEVVEFGEGGFEFAEALEKVCPGPRSRWPLPASIPGRRRGYACRRCGRSRRAGPIRRRSRWPGCRRRGARARCDSPGVSST